MKGKLRPGLHYRLTLLSQMPRFYAEGFQDIMRLGKLGLAEPTGARSAEGSREWAITDAGRTALEAYEKGEP